MFERLLVAVFVLFSAAGAVIGGSSLVAEWEAQTARVTEVQMRVAENHVRLSMELDRLRGQLNKDAVSFAGTLNRLSGQVEDLADLVPDWDFDAMRRSTVHIRVPMGHGSGVIIGPNQILTNAHIAGENPTVTVTYHDGDTASADVLWVSSVGDYALLHVDRMPEDAPVRELACRDPELGEQVALVGNPLVTRETITLGRVASLRTLVLPPSFGPVPPFVVIDVTINGGNSGGPVFDRFGRLLGLGTAELVARIGFYPAKSGLALMWPAHDFCESVGRT